MSWTRLSENAGIVVGLFFPQREALKLDGHGYSPTILHRILHMAGVVSSFEVAEVALAVVGEISISSRHINNLTSEVGRQLQDRRPGHRPVSRLSRRASSLRFGDALSTVPSMRPR